MPRQPKPRQYKNRLWLNTFFSAIFDMCNLFRVCCCTRGMVEVTNTVDCKKNFRLPRDSSALSTCPLVFGCWELCHVIFLMLRNTELLAKLSKFTKCKYFHSKWS